MDKNENIKIDVKLTPEEEKDLSDGRALYEMTKSAGFKILRGWYEDMAFHSWIDPTTAEGPDAQRDYLWKELNAFHAANNAKQIIEKIEIMIDKVEYLDKKKSGEIKVSRMKI